MALQKKKLAIQEEITAKVQAEKDKAEMELKKERTRREELQNISKERDDLAHEEHLLRVKAQEADKAAADLSLAKKKAQPKTVEQPKPQPQPVEPAPEQKVPDVAKT